MTPRLLNFDGEVGNEIMLLQVRSIAVHMDDQKRLKAALTADWVSTCLNTLLNAARKRQILRRYLRQTKQTSPVVPIILPNWIKTHGQELQSLARSFVLLLLSIHIC